MTVADIFFTSIVGPGFLTSGPVHTAIVVGGGAALVSAVIGVFTVMRGQSFAGHALADVSSAGGAASFLLGVNPLLGFLVMAVLAATGMELVRIRRARERDLVTGVVGWHEGQFDGSGGDVGGNHDRVQHEHGDQVADVVDEPAGSHGQTHLEEAEEAEEHTEHRRLSEVVRGDDEVDHPGHDERGTGHTSDRVRTAKNANKKPAGKAAKVSATGLPR